MLGKGQARIFNLISILFIAASLAWVIYVILQMAA